MSRLRGSTGKGISELSLGTAGSFLQGREAGFATLHFCKSLCCRNYFLFPAEFFVITTSIAESSTHHWPVSAVVLGVEQSFLCPTKAGGVSLFSPPKTRMSFSVTFRVRVVVALKLCWMLPWCYVVSQHGVLLWRLSSFSVTVCSSFSLRNSGLVWSIRCTFLMSQMQRARDFFFFHIHFALWEVLDQELRCECT